MQIDEKFSDFPMKTDYKFICNGKHYIHDSNEFFVNSFPKVYDLVMSDALKDEVNRVNNELAVCLIIHAGVECLDLDSGMIIIDGLRFVAE